MSPISHRSRLTGLLAALTLLGVTVAGCSSGSSGGGSDSTASGSSVEDAPATAERKFAAAGDGSQATDSFALETDATAGQVAKSPERSLISTGNIALRWPDVAEARFEVQKVVDRYRGEISQEQTDTDDEGDVNRSRLVVRIPTADFGDAMEDLEGAADLISSDTNTDDVTTQVIDIAVRLRVQRRSIARVETLLDRAQNIGDIISIESQLSSRQAKLGSLERQQAYLADQTEMSTITVSLERTPEKKVVAAKEKKDTTGFVPGLRAGWDGLSSVAVAIATVAGAVLPFAVVLLLLLVPGLPLVRHLRARRTTGAGPEPEPVG